MSSIVEYELAQCERANATGLQPIMFVHGLWLLPSSWEPWIQLFEDAGYSAFAPGWPDDPETADQGNADPSVFAKKSIGQVADHYERIARTLSSKPVVVGHSFGGLIAEILAGRGCSACTVAISPAAFQGVLPLPVSALKSAFPVLKNPANRNRAIPLTFDQFDYAFCNALDTDEAKKLYDTYAVPGAGLPLFQAASANFDPWSQDKVDHANADRGPLLVVAGELDHTVPSVVSHAAYDIQKKNASNVTEFLEMPGRGHSLTIDHGWREVADATLGFVRRFSAVKVPT
ncbi:MAG TPA: alpha/beta hydrolase [Candidatus Tumulicola sp.]